MLASIFVRDSVDRGFDQFFADWKQSVPALIGAELISEGLAGQGSNVIARTGATSIDLSRRRR